MKEKKKKEKEMQDIIHNIQLITLVTCMPSFFLNGKGKHLLNQKIRSKIIEIKKGNKRNKSTTRQPSNENRNKNNKKSTNISNYSVAKISF